MSIMVNGIECYASISPEGFVDLLCRAEKEADFDTSMKKFALIVTETLDDGGTRDVTAPGIDITRLGPVVLDPTTDPPTLSGRWHANIRISEPAKSDFPGAFATWEDFVLEWGSKGADENGLHKTEKAQKFDKVAFIDPASIASQRRVWLGQEP